MFNQQLKIIGQQIELDRETRIKNNKYAFTQSDLPELDCFLKILVFLYFSSAFFLTESRNYFLIFVWIL